jgi:peptidyl-prolyl cis-trans isomerase A (cyclophilin A)
MDPDAAEVMKPEARAERSTSLGDAHFLWFKAMQENGMPPMDAILAATRNIALAYKRPDLGTIEKGKLADVVVLDADPLDDLNNIRKIAMVIKDGSVIDRTKLPMRKVLTTPRSTRVIITTDLGPIEVELEPTRAPKTVENFLKYVDGGFYDGGSFYRTVRADNQPKDEQKIEVLQGGINPAKRAELPAAIALERTKDTGIYHTEGAISMARGAPDSARGEFFICLDDRPSLDFGGQRNKDGQGFAAFGRVVSGLDLVRKIQGMKAEEQRLTPTVKIVKVTRVRYPGDTP